MSISRVRSARYAPIAIAVVYFVFGFLWIVITDGLLVAMTDATNEFTRWQTWKGWVYVLLTAVLAWVLVRRFAGQQAAVQDELTRQRDKLQQAIRDKETLIRELHHRVKNNLQVILSIARLSAQDVNDPYAARQLSHLTGRVHAVSLAHEKILSTGYLETVESTAYFLGLLDATMVRHVRPEVTRDVEIQPCSVPIALAIPCGLIMNEILENAMEHAFPEGRSGTVTVRITVQSEETSARPFLTISLSDDGVGGVPDPEHRSTVGLAVVQAMSHQVGGDLEITSESTGTAVLLSVPLPETVPLPQDPEALSSAT